MNHSMYLYLCLPVRAFSDKFTETLSPSCLPNQAVSQESSSLIINILLLREEANFAEYWKHFLARLNGVHTFGYNSARSEPIWMKFGA